MSPARPRPRPVRTVHAAARLPARVRLRNAGWRQRPCPLGPHPDTPARRPGPRTPPRCVACRDRGHVWLHEDLLTTPGALDRLTASLAHDAAHHLTPLGLGLYGGLAVYGHPDAVPPAR